jgi:hypothetical protein
MMTIADAGIFPDGASAPSALTPRSSLRTTTDAFQREEAHHGQTP